MAELLRILFDTTITNTELIAIMILPGLISGFRRGWQEEGFTAIAVAIAVTELGQRFSDALILIANRLIGVFPLAMAIITNRPPEEWPSLGDEIIPADNSWAQLVAFLLIALVAYRVGAILGRRRNVGLLGRIAGSLFGAIYWLLGWARFFQLITPLEQGVEVDPPTITIMGMRAEFLTGLVFGLIAFIFVLFLLMAWINRRRAAE